MFLCESDGVIDVFGKRFDVKDFFRFWLLRDDFDVYEIVVGWNDGRVDFVKFYVSWMIMFLNIVGLVCVK